MDSMRFYDDSMRFYQFPQKIDKFTLNRLARCSNPPILSRKIILYSRIVQYWHFFQDSRENILKNWQIFANSSGGFVKICYTFYRFCGKIDKNRLFFSYFFVIFQGVFSLFWGYFRAFSKSNFSARKFFGCEKGKVIRGTLVSRMTFPFFL